MPHVGAVPEIVFLNTSGGLTGGDRLSYRVDLGDGCRAVATTAIMPVVLVPAGPGRVILWQAIPCPEASMPPPHCASRATPAIAAIDSEIFHLQRGRNALIRLQTSKGL